MGSGTFGYMAAKLFASLSISLITASASALLAEFDADAPLLAGETILALVFESAEEDTLLCAPELAELRLGKLLQDVSKTHRHAAVRIMAADSLRTATHTLFVFLRIQQFSVFVVPVALKNRIGHAVVFKLLNRSWIYRISCELFGRIYRNIIQ